MSNFVCWWVFFFLGWVFFYISQEKKISPKTKLSSNGNTYILIIFFFLVIFFLPKATKKNTHPIKKNNHQQTKLLIQRKHLYAYDMTFLCPPPHTRFFFQSYRYEITSPQPDIRVKGISYMNFLRGDIDFFFFIREFPLRIFGKWYRRFFFLKGFSIWIFWDVI